MQRGKRFLAIVFILIGSFVNAQTGDFKGWHLLDNTADSINGISLTKTYQLLKGKKSKPVIVAVIDGGIDTTQEDLKNVLWRNAKEIAGNGIDDDGNGYIDDVYGWNFLGGKDGKNVSATSSEAARLYHRYKFKFENDSLQLAKLNSAEKEQYNLWRKASKLLEVNPEAETELMFIEIADKTVKKHEAVLKEEMKKDEFTVEEVEKFATETAKGKQAKLAYLTFIKLLEMDRQETNKSIFSELDEYIKSKKKALAAKETPPQNYREQIIKDNYSNINDKFYGNGDVMGPDSKHGTHVAGIIGAERNNGKGMDGVADNIKIMAIRAVPDGDEYDKDVALAIRYAVDNGAKVINMSFGKGLSPEKKWVDEAVKYAELKDVLLVHAAGNDHENNDTTDNFPNPELTTINNAIAANFITVGASSDPKINKNYVADFSNYGKTTVDVFAPGVKIYSTLPGGNKYGSLEGTSMASPVVAGVASLIRSYYPNLTATQVKYVITHSVTTMDSVTVIKPGTKEKVFMSDLSNSGGWLNAYGAVKLAGTLQAEKPEVKKQSTPLPVKLPKSTFKNLPVKQ